MARPGQRLPTLRETYGQGECTSIPSTHPLKQKDTGQQRLESLGYYQELKRCGLGTGCRISCQILFTPCKYSLRLLNMVLPICSQRHEGPLSSITTQHCPLHVSKCCLHISAPINVSSLEEHPPVEYRSSRHHIWSFNRPNAAMYTVNVAR